MGRYSGWDHGRQSEEGDLLPLREDCLEGRGTGTRGVPSVPRNVCR